MLTRIYHTVSTLAAAQTALIAFRKRYRVALRGACITGPDFHGIFTLHVPLDGTGFSNAEFSGALRAL